MRARVSVSCHGLHAMTFPSFLVNGLFILGHSMPRILPILVTLELKTLKRWRGIHGTLPNHLLLGDIFSAIVLVKYRNWVIVILPIALFRMIDMGHLISNISSFSNHFQHRIIMGGNRERVLRSLSDISFMFASVGVFSLPNTQSGANINTSYCWKTTVQENKGYSYVICHYYVICHFLELTFVPNAPSNICKFVVELVWDFQENVCNDIPQHIIGYSWYEEPNSKTSYIQPWYVTHLKRRSQQSNQFSTQNSLRMKNVDTNRNL